MNSRRAHLLVVENELAQLEGDLGVVNDEWDLSCIIMSTINGHRL